MAVDCGPLTIFSQKSTDHSRQPWRCVNRFRIHTSYLPAYRRQGTWYLVQFTVDRGQLSQKSQPLVRPRVGLRITIFSLFLLTLI
jgi:hypothetical protein